MKKDIENLVETCPLLGKNDKKKIKRNFNLFDVQKQKRIISFLSWCQKIQMDHKDIQNFSYWYRLWKNKKQLQYLESIDT